MRSIAVFGTGSDVGKSVLTAAIARILSNAGYDVAPYKAQNMSNNAGVTPAGGEMGRAQIVQAEAARQVPHVDMNPVLLKPTTDRRSQVVLLGEVLADVEASTYFRDTTTLRRAAYAAMDRLKARHQVLVIEGAGSCAEVNLRSRDFVNFDAAHAADADVFLVADIHKGGVFAQLVGTLDILDSADRARVKGLIVNRFRGDISLFTDGVKWLEDRTGLPVLGVVPWFRDIQIEPEDALPPDTRLDPPLPVERPRLQVGILRLPRIANFTDFGVLDRIPGVAVHWLARPRSLDAYDLLLIPGTKNTRGDLEWLRSSGWEAQIHTMHRRGGHVVGLCGGYQILGRSVADPDGVEGTPGITTGLGLLDVETVLQAPKVTRKAVGTWLECGEPVEGYEIHMGRTTRGAGVEPLLSLQVDGTSLLDGAISGDGRVRGTYLHGALDHPAALCALLRKVRPDVDFDDVRALTDPWTFRDAQYERLAAHVAGAIDVEALIRRVASG